MTIQVGDRMPEGSFAVMSSGESASMSSNELFDDRKVVFVSVPGAFTPTCSMHHLPGLVRNADKILGKGVDTIACMAVNDVYVMNAWGEHLGVGNKLTMLADGNADYTRSLGLEFDASKLGLGIRGQRFVIIAEDGIVTHLAIEEPACFDVTRAETILAAL
jgi:peroxiredoxin